MMITIHRLLLVVVLAALSGPATSVTTETINAAAQALANSGRLSMSMTLQLLISNSSVLSETSSLTVFAPNDAAFSRSGQPSFSRILYQCSPVPYPLPSLHSLPVRSKIPTLLPERNLIITTNANSLDGDTSPSLNGLKIDQDPIFENRSLLILGVDEFFDMGFEAPNVCGFNISSTGNYSFFGASKVLRSNGYKIFASFLDQQLPAAFQEGTALTIFAPADRAASKHRVDDYPPFILRHIVSCEYHWSALVNFEDGFVLGTLSEGFKVNLRKSGSEVLLNDGVRVSHPNLYTSEWLIVHGLDGMFVDPTNGAAAAGVKGGFLTLAGNFLVNVIGCSLFLHFFSETS